MIHNKANADQFHLIGPGDRMEIWWPSAARHVWVTVLAVELETGKRYDGTHYVTGAHFAVHNPHSYVYNRDGSQQEVHRVATLHARRHSGDIRVAYAPDAPLLTGEQHATLLAHLREHGGPESNAVVPAEIVAHL